MAGRREFGILAEGHLASLRCGFACSIADRGWLVGEKSRLKTIPH